MAKKQEQIRSELCKILGSMSEFEKSTRTVYLYTAIDDSGEKVKVQFKGNNFKVKVGRLDTIIKSVPLTQLKVENVERYLRRVLVRHQTAKQGASA